MYQISGDWTPADASNYHLDVAHATNRGQKGFVIRSNTDPGDAIFVTLEQLITAVRTAERLS